MSDTSGLGGIDLVSGCIVFDGIQYNPEDNGYLIVFCKNLLSQVDADNPLSELVESSYKNPNGVTPSLGEVLKAINGDNSLKDLKQEVQSVIYRQYQDALIKFAGEIRQDPTAEKKVKSMESALKVLGSDLEKTPTINYYTMFPEDFWVQVDDFRIELDEKGFCKNRPPLTHVSYEEKVERSKENG